MLYIVHNLMLFVLFSFLILITDAANADSSASVDGSVSSGDEVHGTDSSPAPSPKRHLSNIEGLNQVRLQS